MSDDIRVPDSQEPGEVTNIRQEHLEGKQSVESGQYYNMTERGKHPEDWWVMHTYIAHHLENAQATLPKNR